MSEKQPRSPEQDRSKPQAEHLRASPEHHSSPEKAQLNPAERQKSLERAREKLRTAEAPKQAKEALQPTETAKRGEPVVTRKQRDVAFKKAMTTVRHQLPPIQRSFSLLVHTKPVEVASELLEETFFRPSFLWGGVLGGLVFGGGLYIIATLQGYQLSGTEFIAGLLVGGVLGFVIEKLFFRFRPDSDGHQ